jgi:hypothetical protein
MAVTPSRRTQPLRRGPRQPSLALFNALRGRAAGGVNPADIWRTSARLARAGKQQRGRRRPERPARPPRPARPAR